MAAVSSPAHDVASQSPEAAQLILGRRGTLYPGSELAYWRGAFDSEPYFEPGRSFEDYGPAYELGWIGWHTYGGEFETADRVLANDWLVQKGVSGLTWEQARLACRAAWQRAHNANGYASDGSADPIVVEDTLRELVANANDGALGFTDAAAHTETSSLKEFFLRRAQACRAEAAQLQEQLAALCGEKEEGGTVIAAAHRVWLQIRVLFGGAGDDTLLAECRRGEEAALSACREALGKNLPQHLHDMVRHQLDAAERSRDMIKALLDGTRGPEPQDRELLDRANEIVSGAKAE